MPEIIIGHINHGSDGYPFLNWVDDTLLKRQVLNFDLHVVVKQFCDFLDLTLFFDLIVTVLAIEFLLVFFKLRFH